MSAPLITVYSTSATGCVQCKATLRALTESHGLVEGVHFRVVDLAADPALADALRDEGFRSMPVVKAPGFEPWCGFISQKIAEVAAWIEHPAPEKEGEA